jgi:hypothetical protein
MSNWIPFHSGLREGDKRGLPRAVRFVYLELSLIARPFAGAIPLPRGFKSDLDAVHDMLGGNRREVAEALALLTVPMDPTDPSDTPMLTLSGPPERRILSVTSHSRWVRVDNSTARVRRLRERQSEEEREFAPLGNAFPTVAGTRSETLQRRGEERKREEREESAPVTTGRTAHPPSGISKVARRIPGGKRALPEDFGVSPEIEAMCRREGLANPHEVLPRFADWARGKGERRADWEATFRNWMRDERTTRTHGPWRELRAVPPPAEDALPGAHDPPDPTLFDRMPKTAAPAARRI